jgi:hypothetical protein
MRSFRSFLMVSFVSMALAGLAAGCAMDVPAEGEEELGPEAEASEEALDEAGEAGETTDVAAAPDQPADVAGAPDQAADGAKPANTSSAREDGSWCHAWCYNGYVYAGPNVTQNCTGWADMVCRHRNTSLYNAYWCYPGVCWIDFIL